jgi:hypothetical protein
MITVAIEYPFMLFKRKAIGSAPSSWNELTEKQFIAISRIISGERPDYKFLSVLTGINKDLLKKLSPYELLKLSEEINFISRAGSSHSDFIIRDIPGSGVKLNSPSAKLANVTFGQFIFMDAYYSDYSKTREETSLNKFVACLYQQENQKFSNELIQLRSQVVNRIDIDIRRAIAFNYSLVILWLQKAYPLVFSGTTGEDRSEEKEKPQSNSPWINIFESLVGEDLINRDRYADLPIHTVLRTLTRKYKENARK